MHAWQVCFGMLRIASSEEGGAAYGYALSKSLQARIV